MTRLHLVYLCSEYPPAPHGGIGTVTQTLARSMVARGHRVTVVGLFNGVTGEICEDDQGVRVIRLGAARLPAMNFVVNSFRLSRRLRQLDKEAKIDVIEGQEAAFAFLPASLPGKKIIRMHGGHHFFYTTLGQTPRFWRAWQEKRSFSKADALCAVSRFVASTTCRLLRQDARTVEIIPNPVDTDLFRPQPDVVIQDNSIVFAGTLCEKKGVRQLIQAIPLIYEKVPTVCLFLYGRDTVVPDTGKSFRETLQTDIPEKLRDRIVFVGTVEHRALPAIYASASVCVFPSHMESQGLVVLEAMAVGKAVVASKAGPGMELIEHSKDGLLCEPTNPQSIASEVIAVLIDKSLKKLIESQARNTVMNKFSLKKIEVANENYYVCVANKMGKLSNDQY